MGNTSVYMKESLKLVYSSVKFTMYNHLPAPG